MQWRGVTGTGASSLSASPTFRSTLCLLQKLLSASFKVFLMSIRVFLAPSGPYSLKDISSSLMEESAFFST